PKLPVCFSHGLFGFDQLTLMPSVTISYWRGVIEALEANGCEVLVCRVPMSASIQERAAALKAQIEERFAGREINIVAHSMGGLDSRYLVSQLRPSFSIKSLTTITTPHRGSTFADFMLDKVIGRDKLARLLSMLKSVGLPGGGRAFENLAVDAMHEFNKRVPDHPATRYYSWGAQFTPSVWNEFRIPHGIIYEAEGANDGMVSVESSKWGQYQGTLDNVSHLQIVGW
ncbi:alpha/beta-hydrolase, partial [Tilletiaria anomala UBC 951]